MDKKIIVNNFSRYAHLYDRYASVQRKAGQKLLSRMPEGSFFKILELGSGTGNFTFLLRQRFRDAEIKAVDISDKMVELANSRAKGKKISFINADAEKLNLRERFDLITSNACFHWFENLEKTLKAYKNYLKKEGVIAFSVFGPQTFSELNISLGSVLKDISTSASKFITKARLERFLKIEFSEVEIQEARYKENFSSLAELLKKIKYSGIRGNNSEGRLYFNRRIIRDIEAAYLDKFGRIEATYQVFFCVVKK
ncbi:MAG: malonyl-ACP O-methyltransferase BioC [Candidatus Omnitrophota bacterium]|jgi:malonyl-CoA O-methyltransferase